MASGRVVAPATPCGFPATLEFLQSSELLISGLGLGTHAHIEARPDGGAALRLDPAYPSSALALSLAVGGDKGGLKDGLLRRWEAAHPSAPARPGPALVRDPSPAGTPQGFRLAAFSRDGGEALQRSAAWGGDRPYMVRSMSKAFASSVLLALQDRGLLRIEADPVSRFLPEWAAGELGAVTLRMLLTHTAGLAPFMAQVGDASPPALTDPSITLREAAAQIAGLPRVAPPGAEFHYTELGYQVAGAAAEVAGGASWYELFERYLGGPLELAGTRWFNTFSAAERPPNPLIAIGAVTTGDDLAALARMLLRRGAHVRGDGSVVRVLSEAAVEELTRRQPLGDTSKDSIFAQNADLSAQAQPLADAGLLTAAQLRAVGESWGGVGYGLGCWLGAHPSTGARHVFFLGAYNGVVSLLGWGSQAPLATVLMTYAKSNPSHAVLAGLAWRDWCAAERGGAAAVEGS